jgi:arylsulfatase B
VATLLTWSAVRQPYCTPSFDFPQLVWSWGKFSTNGVAHDTAEWHVGTQSYGCTPAGRGFDTSMGFMDGAEDHWTQASCHTACSCNCPTEATTPNNFMKLLGLNGSTFDMWCTDKPCYNLTGNQFRLGRNGGPVGDISKYGDFQYTQEATQIISKHDPTTPLFFYISFQNNHEPLVRASLTKSRFSPMSHDTFARIF